MPIQHCFSTGFYYPRSGVCNQYRNQAMGWMVRGSNSSRGQRLFIFSKMSRPALGPTQSPIQRVPLIFTGLKWLGCEVNHYPPPSADVLDECS